MVALFCCSSNKIIEEPDVQITSNSSKLTQNTSDQDFFRDDGNFLHFRSIIAMNSDGFFVSFSDETEVPSDSVSGPYDFIGNLTDLWDAIPKGKIPSDSIVEYTIQELPVVTTSNNIIDVIDTVSNDEYINTESFWDQSFYNSNNHTRYDNGCVSNHTYIFVRLVCDPVTYAEWGYGGWIEHKDIIMYIDSENPSNAVYLIQNPTNTDSWTSYTLSNEYGYWLKNEIEIFIQSNRIL